MVSGGSIATRAGVALLDERAELPVAQILNDICYTSSSSCDTPKHTLDLYRLAATGRGSRVMTVLMSGNVARHQPNSRVQRRQRGSTAQGLPA